MLARTGSARFQEKAFSRGWRGWTGISVRWRSRRPPGPVRLREARGKPCAFRQGRRPAHAGVVRAPSLPEPGARRPVHVHPVTSLCLRVEPFDSWPKSQPINLLNRFFRSFLLKNTKLKIGSTKTHEAKHYSVHLAGAASWPWFREGQSRRARLCALRLCLSLNAHGSAVRLAQRARPGRRERVNDH